MAIILPQHNPTLKSLHPGRSSRQTLVPTRLMIRSSATTPPKIPPINTDSLKLDPTLNSVTSTPPVLIDPTLKSTWTHRAWLAGGCTTVLIPLVKSVAAAYNSHIWLEPVLSGTVGYLMADLGSGIYHWGIENYGGAKTPVFGGQIEATHGHHQWPWTITRRQFANNLHALACVLTFTVLPLGLLIDDPVWLGFIGMCSGCIMFSQQFHAWAHMTKSRLPPLVVALQDAGVLVSRSQHQAHHHAPYNSNYCIVSGVWNRVLDGSRFFEALEMMIFFRFGVRAWSWSHPNSEWTQQDSETDQKKH